MLNVDSSLRRWCLNAPCVKVEFMKNSLVIGGLYKHYKGNFYRVKGVVRHSETLEELVYYEALYENELGTEWVRPLTLFLGELSVEGVVRPRFELVESESWI